MKGLRTISKTTSSKSSNAWLNYCLYLATSISCTNFFKNFIDHCWTCGQWTLDTCYRSLNCFATWRKQCHWCKNKYRSLQIFQTNIFWNVWVCMYVLSENVERQKPRQPNAPRGQGSDGRRGNHKYPVWVLCSLVIWSLVAATIRPKLIYWINWNIGAYGRLSN